MLVERALHSDAFRYGCVHHRYCYATILLYLLSIFWLALLDANVLKSGIRVDLLFASFAFNYHFQLNVFYKLIQWEYSTFIRSGTFARMLLIIDYYEIPDNKI